MTYKRRDHSSRIEAHLLPMGSMESNEIRAYRNLWMTVLKEQVRDAEKNKGGARKWLTGNSDGFVCICDAAGFDPERVLRKSRQLYGEDGKKQPTEKLPRLPKHRGGRRKLKG